VEVGHFEIIGGLQAAGVIYVSKFARLPPPSRATTINGKVEIGRVRQLKTEIRKLRMDGLSRLVPVHFEISDFGFELQDSSDFRFFWRSHLFEAGAKDPC
jgi:hypothetical protein